MEKLNLIDTIKKLYENDGNIIQYLKSIDNRANNTIEDILISYDFQAGSYIKGYYSNKEFIERYCSSLAKVINALGNFKTMIEVGVGEATTLGVLLSHLNKLPERIFGFDISWSRVQFAKYFLEDRNVWNATLFTGNLFEIPLPDGAIDIVYTSHSIEPNGGREEEALKELYRIAGQYVILLEPSYEFANEQGRERMNKHGYVTKLYDTARALGYTIIEHRLFDLYSNPLNPTGLLVIKKERRGEETAPFLTCPISKTRLERVDGALYSSDSLLAYPIIKEIPCLLRQNAILAAHFNTRYENFKSVIGIY
jgi:ubiquinone/menaquinone biosynthesis C-methylase UbiE/uncharacterized protein YbaR (Trm112 family)